MASITPSSTRLLSQSIKYRAIRNTVSSCRTFSITAECSAKRTPRQAPSIRRQERAELQQTKRPSSISPYGTSNSSFISEEESFALKKLLETGYKSGAFPLPPNNALRFLEDYLSVHHATSKPITWEQDICNEYKVSPETLFMLFRILNRHVGSEMVRKLAVYLLLLASALGHPAATIEIVSSRLRFDDLANVRMRAPLRRLDELAKKKDIRAMVLLGKIHDKQGREDEALALFNAVFSSSSAVSVEDGVPMETGRDATLENIVMVSGSAVAEAWVAKGKILLRRGDRKAAYDAFRVAALDGGYSPAFYEMAMLMENGVEREEFLKMAAEGGIARAAHEVGVSMLENLDDRTEKNEGPVNKDLGLRRKWAKEWLFLAAGGGLMESAKVLEGLYMRDGDANEAKKWADESKKLVRLKKPANK